MRVASLESVLTAATLVSAIVVVLWAMKIFYGAWTSRNWRRTRDLRPRRGSRQEHHFRGGGSLLFELPKEFVRHEPYWRLFGLRAKLTRSRRQFWFQALMHSSAYL